MRFRKLKGDWYLESKPITNLRIDADDIQLIYEPSDREGVVIKFKSDPTSSRSIISHNTTIDEVVACVK